MPTGTGLDAQVGVKKETTYGTAVTVDRFFEFVDESIKLDVERIESNGIRAGKLNRRRSSAWKTHRKGAAGTLKMEIPNKGFGVWLEHMMGAVATANPSASVYKHTGSVASLNGKSLTVQVGRPAVDDTVHAFTYEGGKVVGWKVEVSVGELAIVELELDFEDEAVGTVETASYPAGLEPFSFVEGTLQVAGATLAVMSASVEANNGLKVDRHHVRGAGLKKEPKETGREYSGTLSAEFESLTAYNRFRNGTTAALNLKFATTTEITTGNKYEFEINIPTVRFDGETPNVDGTEVVEQPLPWVALDDDITIVYQTSDATP